MRIPRGISRIPLWKRDVPKYPLYYSGDPPNRIVLPFFWMKVVPPETKVPPNYVHFQVHPQMSRLDIKQYLEKIYDVPVLNVRTQLKKRSVNALTPLRTGVTDHRAKVWTEEDKYAYVQLRDETFQYPDFFEKGGKTAGKEKEEESMDADKAVKKQMYKATPNQGIPPWFRHIDISD